jgi:hypothetical protein
VIILPHALVLDRLRKSLDRLRNHPEELGFVLSSFCLEGNQNIYGAQYIDRAIKWITENEIHYSLAARADAAKFPSITVTYEGGTEGENFIGDYAGTKSVTVKPTEYARFPVKSFSGKQLVVSKQLKLEDKIWRSLIVKQGKFTATIKSFERDSVDDLVIVLDKEIPIGLELMDWKAQSFVDKKTWIIGSSLDAVRVRVITNVAGDPEICEMFSMIVRYILKQSRFFLATNGLTNPEFSHSALMLNEESRPEYQVFSMEFNISGLLTDQWVLSEALSADRIVFDIVARSEQPNTEEVVVWEAQKPV